jgi:hypothetical protein
MHYVIGNINNVTTAFTVCTYIGLSKVKLLYKKSGKNEAIKIFTYLSIWILNFSFFIFLCSRLEKESEEKIAKIFLASLKLKES